MAVRQATQHRRCQELGAKESAGEQGDLDDAALEGALGLERQDGNDDPGAKDVGEDDEQDRIKSF